MKLNDVFKGYIGTNRPIPGGLKKEEIDGVEKYVLTMR
jgi:hypothetical protein